MWWRSQSTFGVDTTPGDVVLGCPPDSEVSYLWKDWKADRECWKPVLVIQFRRCGNQCWPFSLIGVEAERTEPFVVSTNSPPEMRHFELDSFMKSAEVSLCTLCGLLWVFFVCVCVTGPKLFHYYVHHGEDLLTYRVSAIWLKIAMIKLYEIV